MDKRMCCFNIKKQLGFEEQNCICSVFPQRHKNGSEVPEEENHQAEVVSAGVQHLALPVSLPLHHQHVRHCLWNRRILCVRAGVRSGRRPLRYHSSTGTNTSCISLEATQSALQYRFCHSPIHNVQHFLTPNHLMLACGLLLSQLLLLLC